MRWCCWRCGSLLGSVIFTAQIEVIRFAYCPPCDEMTWQESTHKELLNDSKGKTDKTTENNNK